MVESTTTASSFDSQEEVCPICLLPSSEDRKFCAGPCSHRFCVPDAERILLTKPGANERSPDPHLFVPTLGRCPICRRGMSLFDLQQEEGEDLYEKNTDMTTWPITGKTFAERTNGLSVSFDPERGPTICWYAGQGEEEEERQEVSFQPRSHFHDQSRTFHGEVELNEAQQSTWGGVSLLSCIFQFSSDLRFIALGVIMDGDRRVVESLGLGGRLLYSSGPSQPNERPTHRGNTLWGNTFCQSFKVGLASYQFLTNEEAYISYEHPISSQWPSLDDGSPVPARVFFRNTSFDTNERIFRGEICWQQDYGTTWQGFRKWIYEMKFDSKYTFIVSGKVLSILSDSDEPHEMSTFGNDLVYINAAVDERFRGLVENNADDEEEISDRFNRLSQPLRLEWALEGASVRVIAMLHSALTKLVMGQESPVDFNLS
jgi:hypothetical protein